MEFLINPNVSYLLLVLGALAAALALFAPGTGLLEAGGVTFRPVPELAPAEEEDAVLGTLQITLVSDEPDLHIPHPPMATSVADRKPHGIH